MNKVITYSSCAGRISITRAQERMLLDARAWPKDKRGNEMCSVYRGLHCGNPSYSDRDLRRVCGIEAAE